MSTEPQSHDTTPTMAACSVENLTPGDSTPELRCTATVENDSIHDYKFTLLITVDDQTVWWQSFTHTIRGLSTETFVHDVNVTTPLQSGKQYDVNQSVRNPSVIDTD